MFSALSSKISVIPVMVKPRILVKQEADIQKAQDLMGYSERNCLISNSIKSKVEVMPEIKVGV